MNIWGILETKKTDDLSVIKKAYAKKLKSNHPEDNPAGFQALKEAYDSAVKYAKFERKNKPSVMEIPDDLNENWSNADVISESEDNNTLITDTLLRPDLIQQQQEDHFNINNIEINANSSYSLSSNNIELNMTFDLEKANNQFIEQLDTIYSDIYARNKLENWEKLLNQDVLWNIENRRNLEFMVLNYLSTHYYLSQVIWKLLDESFNLRERQQQLYLEYNDSFVKHVSKLLSHPFPMNYNFMQYNEDFEYDLYFKLKEKIYDLLVIKDSREARIVLNKAKQLYDGDPDLFRMEGIINFLINKFDPALELFNQALSINQNDMESLYYRANISYIKEKYDDSMEDLKIIRPNHPTHLNTVLLAIKCHLKLNNLFEAKDLISRASNIGRDQDTQQTLLYLNKKLKSKLWLRLFLKPWTLIETITQLLSLRQITKITLKTTNGFLAKLCKWIMYAFIFILCIAFVLSTKVGIFVIIFFMAKYTKKK